MFNSNPLVSIIIPVYNNASLIAETLQSVRDQTYQNWECLIINDGSTDNSEEIVIMFCESDSRFKYFKKENGGSATSRNVGLKNTEGNFIQFLDSDDYLYPEKIELSLRAFEKNPQINIVVTSFRLFSSDVKSTNDAWWTLKQEYLSTEQILFGWDKIFSIPPHCGLFKSEVFKNLSFYEGVKAKEDWIMWIEAFLNGHKGYYLDAPLVLFRVHKDSKTKSNKDLMKEGLIKTRNYLINRLPAEYSKQFSIEVIGNLNNDILSLNNKITILEKNIADLNNSHSYKIGNLIVNSVKKITFSKKK